MNDYISLTRDTDDTETVMVTQYYLRLAFTASPDFKKEFRFLWLKLYLQAAGLLR